MKLKMMLTNEVKNEYQQEGITGKLRNWFKGESFN